MAVRLPTLGHIGPGRWSRLGGAAGSDGHHRPKRGGAWAVAADATVTGGVEGDTDVATTSRPNGRKGTEGLATSKRWPGRPSRVFAIGAFAMLEAL